MVCTPLKPACHVCPIQILCKAYAVGDIEKYPQKKSKTWIQKKEELHCIIDQENHILVRRRLSGEWRAGLWDLPAELPMASHQMSYLGKVLTNHVVTRHKIARTTHVWKIKVWTVHSDSESMELRWIPIENYQVAVGSALKKTLESVRIFYRSRTRS